MFCVSLSVDVKMSESEEEFICSQVSNHDFMTSQSSDFGLDIVDGADECQVNGNVVSLELNGLETYNNSASRSEVAANRRILYENVMIEDISSDENDGQK